MRLAGEMDVWEGEAVATSDVTITVEVTEGGRVTQLNNSPQAHFDVQARSWPDWQLIELAQVVREVLVGEMEPYPKDKSPIGLFQPFRPDATSLPLRRPAQGPNRGLAYIQDPIVISDYAVALHPGLFPPPPGVTPGSPEYQPWHQWYDDQNGVGSGTCLSADVARLERNVERHEGVTMASDSHFGVANEQFALLHPHTRFEALYTDEPDADLQKTINREFDDFFGKGPYARAQESFDRTDGPRVFSEGIACTFDFNRRDP